MGGSDAKRLVRTAEVIESHVDDDYAFQIPYRLTENIRESGKAGSLAKCAPGSTNRIAKPASRAVRGGGSVLIRTVPRRGLVPCKLFMLICRPALPGSA